MQDFVCNGFLSPAGENLPPRLFSNAVFYGALIFDSHAAKRSLTQDVTSCLNLREREREGKPERFIYTYVVVDPFYMALPS